jgi:hypothetical protein
MAIKMDTEDRMDRGLDALDGIVDLIGASTTPQENNRIAALLDLVATELRTALPNALSRRLGDNDEE